jgi:hypothetical protein
MNRGDSHDSYYRDRPRRLNERRLRHTEKIINGIPPSVAIQHGGSHAASLGKAAQHCAQYRKDTRLNPRGVLDNVARLRGAEVTAKIDAGSAGKLDAESDLPPAWRGN